MGRGLVGWLWLFFFNHNLRASISEWLPTVVFLNLTSVPIIATSVVFFGWYLKKFLYRERSIFLLALLVGLSATKLFPIFILAAVWVIAQGLGFLTEETEGKKQSRERMLKFVTALFVLTVVTFVVQIPSTFSVYSQLSEQLFYPVGAVNFIREKRPEGNIFSVFYWGGYLIDRLPEKKVFVDGRMSYWQDPSTPFKNGSPLQEHFAVLKGERSIVPLTSQYQIAVILLPRSDFGENSLLIKKLIKNGFKVAFVDKVSIVMEK